MDQLDDTLNLDLTTGKKSFIKPCNMDQLDDTLNLDYFCSRLDNIQITCTDNLKGLTPQHTTTVRATKADAKDICSKTGWSQAQHRLNERFQNDAMNECPVCDKNADESEPTNTLNVADIRGPCGEINCRIARGMRYYIEDLAEEDNVMVDLDELVGPCGKTTCNFIANLKDFIFHRGVFACIGHTDDPNHCCCTETMQNAIASISNSESFCSPQCQELNRSFWTETGCVHKQDTIAKTETTSSELKATDMPSIKPHKADATESHNVQNLYYLTVKVDGKNSPVNKPSADICGCDVDIPLETTKEEPETKTVEPETKTSESKFKYCASTCPKSDIRRKCSKSACDITETAEKCLSRSQSLKCVDSRCPTQVDKGASDQEAETPSPADSDVEINLADIRNQCNVNTCDFAERMMGYIVQGIEAKKNCSKNGDSCFCDCTRCRTNT